MVILKNKKIQENGIISRETMDFNHLISSFDGSSISDGSFEPEISKLCIVRILNARLSHTSHAIKIIYKDGFWIFDISKIKIIEVITYKSGFIQIILSIVNNGSVCLNGVN